MARTDVKPFAAAPAFIAATTFVSAAESFNAGPTAAAIAAPTSSIFFSPSSSSPIHSAKPVSDCKKSLAIGSKASPNSAAVIFRLSRALDRFPAVVPEIVCIIL